MVIGQVILPNAADTGVDVIATKNVEKRGITQKPRPGVMAWAGWFYGGKFLVVMVGTGAGV